MAMGLVVNAVSVWLKHLNPHLGKIGFATGMLLAVVGGAMFFGLLTYLSQFFNFLLVNG